jgi:predicted nuclease of predicted toxin-antitoxin system
VKLLLDQNLSPRLARTLAAIYPDTTHVRDVGLQAADDDTVWAYAAEHGFVIVSKDADFHQRSFVLGPPPKVVWIRRGNCSTVEIEGILRSHEADLLAFERGDQDAFLALT